MVKSNNFYCNVYKEGKAFIEESFWGRSITINLAVPSLLVIDCIGRDTEVFHCRYDLHQSILGAPAPGITVGSAAMKSEQDDVIRLMELSQDAGKPDELWITKKKGKMDIIDFSRRKVYFEKLVYRIDLNRHYFLYFLNNYNFFHKKVFFPFNQSLSSKLSDFIRLFKIDEKVDLFSQFAFAVIELKKGELILIGPFKPVTAGQNGKHLERHHSEHQCIQPIYEYVKKNKSMIKYIYMLTKYNPCLSIKGKFDPCMIELARFFEEMYNEYSIDVYITFQDIYGASGKIVKELKDLSNYEDPLIKKTILELKEMVKKKLCRLKFPVQIFQGNKRINTSKTMKSCIAEEMHKCNLEWKDMSKNLDVISIYFPSKPMTLYEFKSYGEGQANKIKVQLKNLNVSEEVAEKVCSRFYSEWCRLVYEEYEEFTYEKLSDYLNTFAVAFAYKDIKAITNHFSLERVNLSF